MKNQGSIDIYIGFRVWESSQATNWMSTQEVVVPFAITDFGIERIPEPEPVKTFESGCPEGEECVSEDGGVKLYIWLGIALLIIILVLIVICCCFFKKGSGAASRTSFGGGENKGANVGKRSQQESQKEGDGVEMADNKA